MKTQSITGVNQLIGKEVEKMREEHNLTRSKLAGICGLTESKIKKIESGEGPVTIAMLQQIAEGLTITLSEPASRNNIAKGHALLLQQIGRNIKKKRMKIGINQKDLAAASGFEKASVSRIEAGKVNVTMHTLHQVCVAIGTTMTDLFSSEG